jgi:hypothetical protein
MSAAGTYAPAFYDALNLTSLAVLAGEAGESDKAAVALLEASMAASDAFPEGSREAEALSVLLDAASRVPEAEVAP